MHGDSGGRRYSAVPVHLRHAGLREHRVLPVGQPDVLHQHPGLLSA
jgi:hypothetical protein